MGHRRLNSATLSVFSVLYLSLKRANSLRATSLKTIIRDFFFFSLKTQIPPNSGLESDCLEAEDRQSLLHPYIKKHLYEVFGA